MKEDIQFGRIAKTFPRNKLKKPINAQISLIWWISDYKPLYDVPNAQYLRYYVNNTEYRIYNPLRFKFSLTMLKNYIRGLHAVMDNAEVRDFEVVGGTE